MNEIEVISNFKQIVKNPSALKLSDDVFFDKKNGLLGSIDTYNEKIHYLNFRYPDLLIKKIIRSSISDIICKSAEPKFLLISFSGLKKNINKHNIKKIVKSIKQEQKKYNFSLVGGDTSSSKISSFTVCTFGFSKKIIKRNNLFINDDIYLTGNLGDSSIGLSLLQKKINTDHKSKRYFINKYFMPNLPYGFHRELFKFANSSMDISDGVLIDLKKMIGSKKLGFIIDYKKLPKSIYLINLVKKKKISTNKHLFNGDDYQILFTAKKKYRKLINKSAKKWNQKITKIGEICKGRGDYLKYGDKLKKIKHYQGYIHNFN